MGMTVKEKKAYNHQWYIDHREQRLADSRAYYQKFRSKQTERNRRMYAQGRAYVDEAKRVPCTDCGQVFDPVCMDFDHLDPTTKTRTVAQMTNFSIKRIQEEIDKCEVVCSNCHRLRTKKRRTE